jgi:hypothetical protein
MKVISFCVFGSNPEIYVHGLEENLKRRDRFFPEWQVWIYHDKSCEGLKEKYKEEDWIRWISMNEYPSNINATMWRLLALLDEQVEYCIIRDADSRLCYVDSLLVREFIESNRELHVIHEKGQASKVDCGMFGIWATKVANKDKLKYDLESQFRKDVRRGCDRDWIDRFLLPRRYKSILIHDNNSDNRHLGIGQVRPFPEQDPEGLHIGYVYDKDDQNISVPLRNTKYQCIS